MSLKAVGLDLSLTGTGVSVIDKTDANFDIASWQGLPGHHDKRGDRSDILVRYECIKTSPGDFVHFYKRIKYILDEILKFVDLNQKPDLCVIESVFVGGFNKNVGLELSKLGAVVRFQLSELEIPFVDVVAAQPKKFCTGNAQKGEKAMMMLSVYKNWGMSVENNNSCDAFVMSNVALAILEHGKELKQNKKACRDVLTNPQAEVVCKVIENTPYASSLNF
jgi:Holliday junction resolvasome RuvABC endonuclease subunit